MLYEIYFSPTGGTKKTADIICGAWADERKEVDLTERDLEMDEMSFDSEDICIIAVPSFGGRVPGIALSSLKKASGGSARAILVVVYGNRDYDDTLLELKDILFRTQDSVVQRLSRLLRNIRLCASLPRGVRMKTTGRS